MYNILCVKQGTKYSSEYVNKLYSMVQRHTTLPYKFYCFTDDTSDLHPDINVIPLPDEKLSKGWWYKLYMFNKHFDPDTINFYLDLDVVIIDNIDCLLEYEMPGLVGPLDYNRSRDSTTKHLNSSIMRWSQSDFTDLWDKFISNKSINQNLRGDQDYLFLHYEEDIFFFPDEWSVSYKWEFLKKSDPHTKILVFHGDPKPHQIDNGIVKQHWK